VNGRNKLSRNALTLELELLQIRQSLSHLASISSPRVQKDETGSRDCRNPRPKQEQILVVFTATCTANLPVPVHGNGVC